jgi:hypothetical protein
MPCLPQFEGPAPLWVSLLSYGYLSAVVGLELIEDFGLAGTAGPSFSLTPQAYVKFIVEHLLVLRQVLEPYDHTDADGVTEDDLHSNGST